MSEEEIIIKDIKENFERAIEDGATYMQEYTYKIEMLLNALDKEKEKNKEFEEIFKQVNAICKDKIFVEEMPYDLIIADTKYFMSGAFYDNFIQKSKVREKIEERFGILCMQLGSYERDNATSEQERIAGGINELRKLKKELLQEGDEK